MSEADRVFAGSIPALYDRHLGPMLFAGYGEDLARRAVALAPSRVLETAAGTGVLTRALARTVPPEVGITATDLNQTMVDFATAQPGAERVAWRQTDAHALPFPDGLFDTVLCQFGDGAVETGSFHEALNLAAIWDLPVVFQIINNQYGMGTSVEQSSAEPELWRLLSVIRALR